MTNLRKLARGQPCLVRLPGCDGGGETTVLSHYRMLPFNGTGIKPPDILGAWCCFRCHELVDSRDMANRTEADRTYLRLAHAEGVFRTLNELVKRGILK